MKKKTTEAKLDRELVILGWVLVVVALCVVPVYCQALLNYRIFAADIAADDNFSFSHELSVDIMAIIGFALKFAFPICLLGTLVVGLTMILNVRKRKLLKTSQEEELPNQ